jgi:hypothetical protein
VAGTTTQALALATALPFALVAVVTAGAIGGRPGGPT